MRALGPGSVSSFLKVILDVVHIALIIGAAVVSVLALLALLLSFDPDLLGGKLHLTTDDEKVVITGPIAAGALAAAALYMGAVLVIVNRLRRVFVTLTAGDPFHPDNVIRLRVIGLVLAGLELGRYAFWGLAALVAPGAGKDETGLSLTTWFSVLVVFVLAEVFREGARLRREAELTI